MKKMNKILTTVLVIALAALTLVGCAKKDTSPVTTDGSTSMEKVIGTLGEAFKEKEGIDVTYNPTGSGSGIQAVSEGRCDIGLSSRALKDDEKATLTETTVALDGIAMIVNPENPVSDLTVEQIADIYTGKITNWSEVGGNDAAIVLIGREAGSGTRDGFESITGTKDACQYRQELILHRRRHHHRLPEPGRHRLCFPCSAEGQRQGSDRRRRGPHGGYRQGRQLCHPATVRSRDQDRREALRERTEVLRLRPERGSRQYITSAGAVPVNG